MKEKSTGCAEKIRKKQLSCVTLKLFILYDMGNIFPHLTF